MTSITLKRLLQRPKLMMSRSPRRVGKTYQNVDLATNPSNTLLIMA